MLNVIMLSVVMLMLNVAMLNVAMLHVIILSAVMLNVAAPISGPWSCRKFELRITCCPIKIIKTAIKGVAPLHSWVATL